MKNTQLRDDYIFSIRFNRVVVSNQVAYTQLITHFKGEYYFLHQSNNEPKKKSIIFLAKENSENI